MMGTPDDFKGMMELVTEHQIIPVIDEVFPLSEADAAVKKMENSSQFGKIVLRA
jgi:zinc-binding alcohol dehydrogenase/oxidoreductase